MLYETSPAEVVYDTVAANGYDTVAANGYDTVGANGRRVVFFSLRFPTTVVPGGSFFAT